MMNPEMMKMASEMMAKMTPDQIAQMQEMARSMSPEMMQQAMAAANNVTPEQLHQMQAGVSGMSGDQFASTAAAQMGPQQQPQLKHELDTAAQLKAEGNRLHGARQFRQAAEQYERALTVLQGQSTPQSQGLRISCQSNLGSCFLQLERWQECVNMCNIVLNADGSNRKALYRRGQALCALGHYDGAVNDLHLALKLSPESEKYIIQEKLKEAKDKQRQASQGMIIEEVTEPAAAAALAPAKPCEGGAQSDTDDNMPPLEELQPNVPATVPVPSAATASSGESMPPAVAPPPGLDSDRMRQTAEMMKNNPDMARQAAAAMATMSDDQIASLAAQSGMPGITPAMAKQAAAIMRSMPPEQLSAMAAQASTTGGGLGGFSMPSAAAMAAPAAAAPAVPASVAAAATAGSTDQVAAAAEAMRKNPDMMKHAAAMMESMSEEELCSMAAMMPGGGGMQQMDPAQMKMAAKMMAAMSPKDMERMTKMATSLGAAAMVPGIGGGSSVPTGSAAVPMPGMPGMPGFDPASLPPDMMSSMREKMQDPEMLKMLKSMMKTMDPAQLAEMMQASGVDVTPEQARSVVDKLDSVSDKHLEMMVRLMGYVDAGLMAFRRTKEWVFSQGALAIALTVLLIALLLRWLGWV